MALARFALRNLQRRMCGLSSSSVGVSEGRFLGGKQNETLRRFANEPSHKEERQGGEVAVTEAKRPRLFPRRNRRRSWLWRDDDRDFSPALNEFFPSGLGNALMQATQNINRVFEHMNSTPWSFSGRVKESNDHYKLRYDMPGVAKEDVKITVDDGVLTIKGEHKEEKEEGDDDSEYWSSSSYGYYYNTALVLPDDAKTDDIKAELKDGVLTLTIPKTQSSENVKHVTVN